MSASQEEQKILFCLGNWHKVQSYIYMVQYAIFGKFCQNVRNLQNFDFAPIFYEIHHMSYWMSLTASHILESCRMGSFLQESFPFIDFLHCFLGVFCTFYKIASIWICHMVCFISLAINMLVGWDICHLKGGIHSSVLSTKTFLYNIRKLRCSQNKMEYVAYSNWCNSVKAAKYP